MGIFDAAVGIFQKYHASITFRDRVVGGTPKDPSVVEKWLRAKAGIESDEEVRQMTIRTMRELGVENAESLTFDQLVEASKELASKRNTNGFKFGPACGLYLESRTVKSMIKEAVNILYAGERWGRTSKGPKNFTAERVFIDPDRLYLDRMTPDGVELFIGHISGPSGPTSNLTYYEHVIGSTLEIDVRVTRDEITFEHWQEIWVQCQEIGLGALRSQGYGRFDLNSFDVVEETRKRLTAAEPKTPAARRGRKAASDTESDIVASADAAE